MRDLHAFLAAADVRGPYKLLGFSFGGLLAPMYAGTYPDEVMGILMLDASLPTDDQVDALIPGIGLCGRECGRFCGRSSRRVGVAA